MPVIIRVDGKAFHSLTAKCVRPFDPVLMAAMDYTAQRLCEEIQGAQLAYVQSDEISVLVHNYKRINSEAWFDNNVQKMVSVSASIATAAFNKFSNDESICVTNPATRGVLWTGQAMFDARVFVLPEAEVCNAFLWRQMDAERNSVQMVARSLYSHKECENKNCSQLQEMCFQRGVNWDSLPIAQKRGRCIVRISTTAPNGAVSRGWMTDYEIPRFGQQRSYIDNCLATEPEET